MRRFSFVTLILAAVMLLTAAAASAQTGQLRGSVKMIGADGSTTPVAGAIVDVWRTDITGEFHTKSDKSGGWVFAGLPFVGTYVVSISAPGAAPATRAGVKAGRDIPVDVVLNVGDGRKFTRDEAIAASKGGGGSDAGTGSTSASDKEKAAELAKKQAAVNAENEKITNANQVIGDAFKNGNAALTAKNYEEAIRLYDSGINADPEHPGIPSLLTNKASALRSRGVEKYNAAIQSKDNDGKAAAIEAAKADFKAAAEASNRAVELFAKQPAGTTPEEQKNQTANKYFALSGRAESMRLFVTKVDPTQADAGAKAFEEYMAIETDPAKKAKAQIDLAQMLFDAGAADRAMVEFKKILDTQPGNVDALYGMGIAEISAGYAASDKVKLQEGVNYLQQFVDKAPDTHRYKAEAKATLEELKNTEKVVPEKTTKPAGRGKRP